MTEPDAAPLNSSPLAPLMRRRLSHTDSRVSFVELFFDLVFVYAIAQLSHYLLTHFSVLGAVQMVMLILAVWWQWSYTTWVTNWLNPEKPAVRLMLLLLMLLGLVLSTSIPEAFAEKGWLFGAGMAAMHLFRTLFTLWAVSGSGQQANLTRILAWGLPNALLWILGGVNDGATQMLWWGLALFQGYLAAWVGFITPGLGQSTTREWDISGEHMAERAGLFVILALGESVMISGATFSELKITTLATLGMVTAFAGTVAMWWLYFVANAQAGNALMEETEDTGSLARSAYTYTHILIVLGIILAAVGDEFLLKHPTDDVARRIALSVIGGPALFLLGNLMFKTIVCGLPWSHVAGLVALGALFLASGLMNTLTVGALVVLVLVVVAAWESRITEQEMALYYSTKAESQPPH